MSDPVAIIAACSGGVVAIITAYGAIQAKKTHTIVNSRTDIMVAHQQATDERVEQLVAELRTRGDGTVPKAPTP
jgi:hypothetical protein